MEHLKTFFDKYIPGTDLGSLVGAFELNQKLKKKEFLLQPEQDCSFLAFVKKGAFRVFFYNNEGVEVTVWFSFAGMMVSDLLAFYQQSRAMFYVQAIEDSEIVSISREALEEQFSQNTEYLQFGRKYAEFVSVNVMERMLSLQTKSAEDRYRELLSNPKYMQKIPLKYLASYIGITDTSLSRIRKQLV